MTRSLPPPPEPGEYFLHTGEQVRVIGVARYRHGESHMQFVIYHHVDKPPTDLEAMSRTSWHLRMWKPVSPVAGRFERVT